MEKKKLFEILVPTHFNNGDEVSIAWHNVWDDFVKEITNGLTIQKPAKGVWVSNEAEVFKETMIPVKIICSDLEIKKIADFTIEHYKQLAVTVFVLSSESRIYKKDK